MKMIRCKECDAALFSDYYRNKAYCPSCLIEREKDDPEDLEISEDLEDRLERLLKS